MNKKLISLTESDIHKIVKESVHKIIAEKKSSVRRAAKEEKIKAIISECIKHYIREGYWDDETDPIKLAEMYKECVVRFDNAIKAAIEQRGGLENIREGEVILEISSRGWRYWDSEHKALKALSDKYYRCPWRKDSAKTNIMCFQRNHSANNRVEYIFVKGNEKPSNLWGDISRGW